jgi:hypothetical protein
MGRVSSVVEWSEGLSNRVSNNIRRYTDHIRFAAYMAASFITSFVFFWFYSVSLYVYMGYVLYASVEFCTSISYVFLLLCMFRSVYYIFL